MVNKTTLPDDEVRAIGRVVVNFQHLEFTIVRLIWVMAAPDDNIGQRITACVMFAKLLDLLSSVFHYRVQTKSITDKFDALMAKARDINKGRNRIVHSWWFTNPDGSEPSRLKISGKNAQQDSDPIDKDALAIAASDLADDFDVLIDELYEAKLIRKKPGLSPA